MGAHKVWRKAFLKSLADCGIVRAAAEEAGIDPKLLITIVILILGSPQNGKRP